MLHIKKAKAILSLGCKNYISFFKAFYPMNKSNLTLIFDGSAVENGEIDVNDLAPALISLGELIKSANQELNGHQAQISVRVKATAEGSFEVDLSILQSLKEKTRSLFEFISGNKDDITAAKEIVELIFKIVGIAGGGLFALMKFLKGRKPDKIEEKEGNEVHIHINGNIFIADKQTIQLAESIPVRKHARKALDVLSKDGIEKIKIKREKESTLEILKEEVNYFDIEEQEEEIEDLTREMELQIISLSFNEDNKWRVTDGGEPFNAVIEDIEYLKQIANNEVSFAKGDYLICNVRERQFRTTKGLKKDRRILKVVHHEQAAQHARLV